MLPRERVLSRETSGDRGKREREELQQSPRGGESRERASAAAAAAAATARQQDRLNRSLHERSFKRWTQTAHKRCSPAARLLCRCCCSKTIRTTAPHENCLPSQTRNDCPSITIRALPPFFLLQQVASPSPLVSPFLSLLLLLFPNSSRPPHFCLSSPAVRVLCDCCADDTTRAAAHWTRSRISSP